MPQPLENSMFHQVFFPPDSDVKKLSDQPMSLRLQRLRQYRPAEAMTLLESPVVVFDFETTGLDSGVDRIVEIGAIRLDKFVPSAEFSTLVRPDVSMGHVAANISGITEEMLKDAPKISEVLPKFLDFFRDSILIAHNADFDMAFLKAACVREGIELSWPCFCSLKMARVLLPSLESKGLDGLAMHFGLEFEARHRSIGDVKVTCEVLRQLLGMRMGKSAFETEDRWQEWSWKELQPFAV